MRLSPVCNISSLIHAKLSAGLRCHSGFLTALLGSTVSLQHLAINEKQITTKLSGLKKECFFNRSSVTEELDTLEYLYRAWQKSSKLGVGTLTCLAVSWLVTDGRQPQLRPLAPLHACLHPATSLGIFS